MQQRQSCPSGCGSTCPGRGFLKPAGGGFRPRRAGGPAHPQTTKGCGLPSNMRNNTEREATSTCQLHSVKTTSLVLSWHPWQKLQKVCLAQEQVACFLQV